MLGAAGAILCMTAGTAVGIALRERRYARLKLMENEQEVLARMRLMLIEERLGIGQLLRECAGDQREGGIFDKRLFKTAAALENDPLLGLAGAYRQACQAVPAAFEQEAEKAAMESCFSQLGSGTAAMREQAAASTMRRLKPLMEQARGKAERGGRLLTQLGLLLGLMVGIALW